jgi:hypothetical protein
VGGMPIAQQVGWGGVGLLQGSRRWLAVLCSTRITTDLLMPSNSGGTTMVFLYTSTQHVCFQ